MRIDDLGNTIEVCVEEDNLLTVLNQLYRDGIKKVVVAVIHQGHDDCKTTFNVAIPICPELNPRTPLLMLARRGLIVAPSSVL